MSLLKQQNFLAKLYTDERLRIDFTFDPQKIGIENGLNLSEIEEISAIYDEEIKFFAESLFRKRMHEAAKCLPLTNKILKADFEKSFRSFSQNFQPQTIKKHLEDAIEFCRFLQKNDAISAIGKDAAKYEAAKLRFFVVGEKYVFCRLRYNVHEIARCDEQADNLDLSKMPEKNKLFVWLRFGKKIKHFTV